MISSTSTGSSGAARTVEHVTCLGCGCACDDITITVRDGRIADAGNACRLGVSWFGDGGVPAAVRISGRDASLNDAIAEAARLLATASQPLVFLAPDISCEAQRDAVAIADALHASLDSVTSAAIGSVLAAQERGRAGATLGEVRHRADVLVFWGVDPAARYPRYWSRYAPEPAGIHVPDGRRSRKVIAVDVGASRGPADADVRLSVAVRDEVATIAGLVSSPHFAAARYIVIVADAEPDGPRDPGRAEALIALAQALNGPARSALSLLRGGGNRSGADAVLTWQTGYPVAIDFSRGQPRYRPHDGSAAARLLRGELDAALVIGSTAAIAPDVAGPLATRRTVVIGPRASDGALAGAQVVIDTGVAGIHEGGTALRMDDVPLPLRASIDGPPIAAGVVAALRKQLISSRQTET